MTAIMLTPVDDSATLDLRGASVEAVEDGGSVAVAPAAVLADVDESRVGGGIVTIGFGEDADAGDSLTVGHQGHGPGQIGVSGTSVTYGGVQIGTFSGGADATPLTIMLAPGASLAAVQALLRAVHYASSAEIAPGGPRSLLFQLVESDGDITADRALVSVTSIDDPAAARNDEARGGEDTAIRIDVGANDDPDGPAPAVASVAGAPLAIGESITLPSGATVTVVADGVLSYDPGGAFDALAEGENGEDGFSYTLAGGTSAAVSITLTGPTMPLR
jgi:hypothetical protein